MLALFETMLIGVNVGAVRSNITVELLVVELPEPSSVIRSPARPKEFSKSIWKAIEPSLSVLSKV